MKQFFGMSQRGNLDEALQGLHAPQFIMLLSNENQLEALLKLADAVPSGGMAKNLIQDGQILVNGEVCTMRGKKLRPGDTASCLGATYTVTTHEA